MSGQSDDTVQGADPGNDGLLGGHGLDRRSLIKKAGIAGAAAWVAPMVLDSVLSPASAASLPPGIYKLRLSSERCNPTPVLDPSVTPLCQSGFWSAAGATLPIPDEATLANLGLKVSNCSRRYVIEVLSSKLNVTIVNGTSCQIKDHGSGPLAGVVSNGGAQIDWSGTASDRRGYFIVIKVV